MISGNKFSFIYYYFMKCVLRYDMCGWHSDSHPQVGRNPPVASVSEMVSV
jgi:hypothetical protein